MPRFTPSCTEAYFKYEGGTHTSKESTVVLSLPLSLSISLCSLADAQTVRSAALRSQPHPLSTYRSNADCDKRSTSNGSEYNNKKAVNDATGPKFCAYQIRRYLCQNFDGSSEHTQTTDTFERSIRARRALKSEHRR